MEFYKVETKKQAEDLIRIIPEIVAIDTEFIKGDPRTTELLSVIVADSERAWVIDPSILPMLSQTIRARKLVFLQDYNHCDTIILLKNGVDLRGVPCHNLIDMQHLINENADHSLSARILTDFGDDYKRNFWSTYSNYEDAPKEEQVEYAGKDAIYTYRLGIHDLEKVHKMPLYEHIRELSKALLDTELNGVCVNTQLMIDTKKEMSEKIAGHLPKLRKEFNEYCNIWELQKWQCETDKRSSDRGKLGVRRPVFSFTSDKQLSWLVYEALKLPVIEKTKTGNPSTSYEALYTLSKDHPCLQQLVEYKDTKTVYSTFVEGMLERVKEDRIYPYFNVSGTATGRISHSDPNMGNLPKDGIIRNFFIPSDGMVIIGADYEQLEVVIEANLTEDQQLLKIILEGASKHDITAQGLGINRKSAKTLNFALQYGAGHRKIAKILGISEGEAEVIFKRYWELYSGVHALKERVNKEIEETGQIMNLAGRTRHFPKVNSIYEVYRQQRQAYNFLIQGAAGEACNRAYYRFHNWLKDNAEGRGLFPIHDEIVCEVYQQDPQRPYWLMQNLVETMEDSTKDFNFKYPLKAKAYGPLKYWTKT